MVLSAPDLHSIRQYLHVSAAFIREWVRSPRTMGMVCPSGTSLAHAMAAGVPLGTGGLVVELGAGTGAVTQELLRAGVAPYRLLIVEKAPGMTRLLQKPPARRLSGPCTRRLVKEAFWCSTHIHGAARTPFLHADSNVWTHSVSGITSLLPESFDSYAEPTSTEEGSATFRKRNSFPASCSNDSRPLTALAGSRHVSNAARFPCARVFPAKNKPASSEPYPATRASGGRT